jgi:hypothetical protein
MGKLQDLVRSEVLGKLKKFIHLIGSRTLDLLPRAPWKVIDLFSWLVHKGLPLDCILSSWRWPFQAECPRMRREGSQLPISSAQCKMIIQAVDERTVTRTMEVSSERISCFWASRKLGDNLRTMYLSAWLYCRFVFYRQTFVKADLAHGSCLRQPQMSIRVSWALQWGLVSYLL